MSWISPFSRPTRCAAVRLVPPLLVALGGATLAPAQTPSDSVAADPRAPKKRLTLDAIFGPEGQVDFDGSYATGMTWIDAEHFLHRRAGELRKVHAVTDAAEPAYDVAALEAALVATNDFTPEQAQRVARSPGQWSDDRSTVLIRHERTWYVWRRGEAAVHTLLKDPPAPQEDAAPAAQREEVGLGPTGRFAAFVQHNDLHLVDLRSGRLRRITRDGHKALQSDTPDQRAAGGTILNGKLDWVYQEEVYGRGRYRAYWFSPDEAYVAFLRLDESQVPIYTIIDPIPLRQKPERMFYPKAGDPNPTVRLAAARTRDGAVRWVDLSDYRDIEFLIVQVSWSPHGTLIYSVQDREQTWMDLNEADPRTGRSRRLLRETSPAWVENFNAPRWLRDGSFLWLSDRDGFRHIYYYAADGRLHTRVTQGPWQVRAIHEVDESGNWIYFEAEKDNVFESHAYRVPILGGTVERLTELGYRHACSFAPGGGLFLDTFSSLTRPPRVHLRRGDGALVRVISDNDVPVLDEYVLSTPALLRVPSRDGHLLNAELIRPVDYDPTRKYPVWCPVYAGPDSQSVTNRWGGRGRLFEQYLVNELGIILWRCDPRSGSGNSKAEAWHAYGRLGVTELADIEDGLKWLIAQGGVDETRIGIAGHSYGGYMAAYALTHSTMFRCGIAGAPVTDWRNYDSIYTERYMKLPKHNPDGYDASSVVQAAANLHGRLLIAHGSQDENVHMANTQQLIAELQRHRKQFDLMNYPRDRHGFGVGGRHWRELQLEFIRTRL